MTAAIDIVGATLRADDLSQLRALVEAGISTSLPRRVLLVARELRFTKWAAVKDF